jgi:hypothetical protein
MGGSMIKIEILENKDVIKSGDFVRQLALQYDGQSDYLPTTNTYSGDRMNRLGWITVDEFMPAFIGKRLKDYYLREWHYPPLQLEIVRGCIPRNHLEDNITYWHISKFDKPQSVSY